MCTKQRSKKNWLFYLSVIGLIVTIFPGVCFSQPAASPIVFGMPAPLGESASISGWRAAQMAVEEINAKGGVLVGGVKRPIEIYSIDTREHEPGIPIHDALMAIEKLILEKKPHAIAAGPMRSEVLLAALDAIVYKYKLPYMVTIAMTPVLEAKISENYDKYRYVFRINPNAIYVVKLLSEVMGFLGKEFGFKKAYLICQDVLWAKATINGLEKGMKATGWEIVGKDVYPTGASEFSASLAKVKETKAQVIIPVFDMPQAAVLLKQARAMKVPAIIAGGIEPAARSEAWKVFGGEVEGFINTIFTAGHIPVKAIPRSVGFYENYGKKWGKTEQGKLSQTGAATAYDSVYVLVNAIERAGTLDSEALVKGLEKTDMIGAIGRIRFSKGHQVIYGFDPKESAIGVAFQWVKGERVVVFPAQVAEGKILLPPYMK